MEEKSRRWYFTCECGHEFDVWSIGGIRYKAAGNPWKLITCPQCGKTAMRQVHKRSH